MNILVINPNTNEHMTETIEKSVVSCKLDSTMVKVATNTIGPASIEGHVDEAVSTTGVLELIINNVNQYDAFVIACFSNHPSINGAREITDKPVVGIAEASMHMACMLGDKFGIVTTSKRWVPLLNEAVEIYGLERRCAGIKSSGLSVLEVDKLSQEKIKEILTEKSIELKENKGAEVICLGCAGMSGFEKDLEKNLGIPVIDSVACAVKFAEMLCLLGLKTSRCNLFAPLDKRLTKNLPQAIEKMYC